MTNQQKQEVERIKSLLEFVLFLGQKVGRDKAFQILEDWITEKRVKWLRKNKGKLDLSGSEVEKAFQLIYKKFGIDPKDLKITKKTSKKITYCSYNFCPVLEACKILDLDTREVCKKAYERSVTKFLKEFDSRLTFKRNYKKIRPYAECCEETIELESD